MATHNCCRGAPRVLLALMQVAHACSCQLPRARGGNLHLTCSAVNLQSGHPTGAQANPAARQKANPAAGGLQARPSASDWNREASRLGAKRRPLPPGGRPSAAAGGGASGMSAGGSFGGARGFQPRPPEKGVFPLDHFGECKSVRGVQPSLLGLAPWLAPCNDTVLQRAQPLCLASASCAALVACSFYRKRLHA